jgi:hypothetical protein
MVMDTGAATSCMYDCWYSKNKENLPELQKCPFKIMTADGSRASVMGYIPKVSVQVNGQLILTGLIIIKSNKKGAGLLGLDALEQMDVLFDIKERLYVKKKKNREVQTKTYAAMNEERQQLCTLIKETLGTQKEKKEKESEISKKKKKETKEREKEKEEGETKERTIQLYAATRVEIPSMSRATVWTTATSQSMDKRTVWVTEADSTTPPHLILGRVAVKKTGEVPIQCINTSDSTITVAAGSPIGKLTEGEIVKENTHPQRKKNL